MNYIKSMKDFLMQTDVHWTKTKTIEIQHLSSHLKLHFFFVESDARKFQEIPIIVLLFSLFYFPMEMEILTLTFDFQEDSREFKKLLFQWLNYLKLYDQHTKLTGCEIRRWCKCLMLSTNSRSRGHDFWHYSSGRNILVLQYRNGGRSLCQAHSGPSKSIINESSTK